MDYIIILSLTWSEPSSLTCGFSWTSDNLVGLYVLYIQPSLDLHVYILTHIFVFWVHGELNIDKNLPSLSMENSLFDPK